MPTGLSLMYKDGIGNIPNRDKVRSMLDGGYKENPGRWIIRSHIIGKTCEKIARDLDLDEDVAYACGALFNIGKAYGHGGLDQFMAGYRILRFESYFLPARVALGYGFVTCDIKSYHGVFNINQRDFEFLKAYLQKREISPYEKLVIVLDNLIGETYLGLEKIEEGRNISFDHIRENRLEILKQWEKNLEDMLGDSIESYLPRPRYYKFPYNLFRKSK